MSNVFSSPVVHLTELNNLFIELTAKNCNQKCKHCYIDFPINKNIKDFISIDKIKTALNDTTQENLQWIYLTGAEPMMHPEFNTILRTCLKRCNVCICTNASFINEKKARFLKKVEDESEHEIIFKLSIDHYNEVKNDNVRSRGAYRQTLNAAKNLLKYGFNPVFNITNYYNEDKKILIAEFQQICQKIGLEPSDFNFQINEYYNKYQQPTEIAESKTCNFDCQNSRILTDKGTYACPFLANDHRGWVGNDLKKFSKKIHLESDFCQTCIKNEGKIFSLNW